MRSALRLLLVVVAVGCGGTRVIEPAVCHSNTECPEGYACNAGVCEATDPVETPDAGTVTPDGGTVIGVTSSGLCASCQTDEECGAGAFCLADDQAGATFCGTACSTSAQCEAGSKCYSVSDVGGNTLGRNCFPTAGTCTGWPGVTTGGMPDAGTTTGTPDAGTGTGTADAGTGSTCGDTWANYGKGFFSGYCNRCHSWGATYTRVKGKSSKCRSEISSGGMPRGTRLSATEKARILKWIDCGMPQ